MAELSCDRLSEYREKAAEQARTAVEHFKDDFIFKIRSAIKEAYHRERRAERDYQLAGFRKG